MVKVARRFRRVMVGACAALLALTVGAAPGVAQSSEEAQTYIVVYGSSSVPRGAEEAVEEAGGELVHSYDPIGVVIARADDPSFRENMLADQRVEAVSSTAGFGVQLSDAEVEILDGEAAEGEEDPYQPLQWDMAQIQVPEAHEVTRGDASVVVGVLDTGIDYSHPDLAANIDFSRSISCVAGVPDEDPDAWQDRHGHGTHVAGTIAAAANGVGIVGIAPEVKLAAVKTGNDDGYFYPEAVICAFMWAAEAGIDVTNNSYFADPYWMNCRNDETQHAIWKAEQRAIRYAISQGVTVVAAAGNELTDLAHPEEDNISPSDGTPEGREVTNACAVVPAEVSGVITVSSNGVLGEKAYYSNYGMGVVDIAAPGGDRFQVTDEVTNGRILSTWTGGQYAWAQGTSMASPHVAGVAALVLSEFGSVSPGRLQAILTSTADPLSCPDDEDECQGRRGNTSYFGHGRVNAYSAVTHSTR